MKTILSYGLGRDSTTILFRWFLEGLLPCAPQDLIVITAQTGDEFPDTKRLVERYVYPILRQHNIRTIQVARHGPTRADDITILDDTREPSICYIEGDYRLSEEMLSGGTVPEFRHHKCAIKSKGIPIDTLVCRLLGGSLRRQADDSYLRSGGEEYSHVLGFNADELKRVERDRGYGGQGRHCSYPLVDWSMGHSAVAQYAAAAAGEPWEKSACWFCPFTGGREEAMDRYRRFPAQAAQAMFMERISLSFNPAMTLYSSGSVVDKIMASGNDQAMRAYHDLLLDTPWSLYEIGRCRLKKQWDRSVRKVGTWSQGRALAMLEYEAAWRGADLVTDGHGISRAWFVTRQGVKEGPDGEAFLVACPDYPKDKAKKQFEKNWDRFQWGRYALPLA